MLQNPPKGVLKFGQKLTHLFLECVNSIDAKTNSHIPMSILLTVVTRTSTTKNPIFCALKANQER